MSEFENFMDVHAVVIVSKFNKGEYIDSLWATKEEAQAASEQLVGTLGEFYTVEIEKHSVKRTTKDSNYDA